MIYADHAEAMRQLVQECQSEGFDAYLEELMSDLVEEEEYVFILNRGFNLEIE